MMMISPALVGAYVPGLSLQQPRVQQQSIQMGVESMCLPARSLHSLRRGAQLWAQRGLGACWAPLAGSALWHPWPRQDWRRPGDRRQDLRPGWLREQPPALNVACCTYRDRLG